MDKNAWYWLILFLFVVGCGWAGFDKESKWAKWAWPVMLVLLFVLIGFKSFGDPVH